MSADDASLAAWLREIAQMQERGQAALRAVRDLGDVQVGVSARSCVYTEGKIQLFRYTALARPLKMPPVLICYAMVNRPYMLDLQPDRSFIRELLSSGVEVYLVDWGYPDGADRFTALDEYLCGSLERCVQFILQQHGLESLSLLGVCQGGTLSLCYAAWQPERVANLITMVTPVDFKTPENLLTKWVEHIDVGLLTQSGNVAGEFLNLVYLSLMPFRLTHQKYVDLLLKPGDRAHLEYFMRMEKWIFDSPDQPARAFREFVVWFYQENRLIRGELELGGRPIRLRNITQPVLNIYAQNDHLVPPSASVPLGAHVGSQEYRELPVPVGHIGMYVSSKAHKTVPAAITQWLVERQASR